MLLVTMKATIATLLLLAAWRDVVSRIIPNRIPLLVAALGLALRSAAGTTPLLLSTATALLLFAALLLLVIRGWLGGGDAKLAAAIAIGLPPAVTWDFVNATVLAGGLLGLGYLAGPRFAPRLRPTGASRPAARILAIEARRLRRGGPLPYGVAIAVGGILILLAGS
ncbi:prepilin peptidase [Siccirubricoccus deserti]|uniref:Prepilin peptidase n=1 Tax=Siccirubricoccus deserti TaxID=2013562 RepID=A0A9X0QZB1_9PROT|nr:prepilin peptidase [Siccirubricoccus deserti]MBC4016655.1 prepilin peptidase [Siccirubricoccus deserti]GGC50856.1 prepilin peptidase [Siccirubricoccus deserti]